MDIQANGNVSSAGGMMSRVGKKETESMLGTKNIVEDKLSRKTGIKDQVQSIYETFGVDSVMKGIEHVNLVEESGNKGTRGLLNNVVLGENTGKGNSKGSKLVANNNMLDTWNEATQSTRRKAVMDYSTTPEEKRQEKMKAIRQLDVEA